ncbi:MAG: BolA/IbaG family iron-sulfur metabolism protein [Halioglobus sp.]|nr:BolA/IbaG family iron-sulfur metabolism protein [Halioglobus sp.]
MDPAAVKELLQNHMPDCEFHVEGEGSHYDIAAIGSVFEGLRPVKKQQLIYAALTDHIANGSIHAVNIRTYTPEQWQAQAPAAGA